MVAGFVPSIVQQTAASFLHPPARPRRGQHVAQGTRSFFDTHYFLIRRLHSLSGIVPIGVFLIAHLVTNSSIVWGKMGLRGERPELSHTQGGVYYFQKEVSFINTSVPHLLLIEVTLWAAIAFHSVLGLVYARQGCFNTARYAYQGNRRYAWQRITGYVGVVYIFYHVATLRWGWDFLVPGGATWDHHAAASTMALALRGGQEFTAAGLLVSAFYFVGVSMLVFHFANGLWTAAITWGLTVSAQAQKRWGYACAGLGAGLMGMAWMSVIGFATLSPAEASKVERLLNAAKEPTAQTNPAPAPAPGQQAAGVPS